MAEIQLRIGDSTSGSDGDIEYAINDRWASIKQAIYFFCNTRKAKRDPDTGYLAAGELAIDFLELIYPQKVERVGVRELLITDRKQNRQWKEDINPARFLHQQRRRANNQLFGEDGRECWFQGRTNYDDAHLIWDAIEAKTGESRGNYLGELWGEKDLRELLVVRVRDFSDQECASLCEPHYWTDRGRYIWQREGDDGILVEEVGTQKQTEPPPGNGWRMKVKRRRRRRFDWSRILYDLQETRETIRDKKVLVGRADQDARMPRGIRYRSKEQRAQPHSKIKKKT